MSLMNLIDVKPDIDALLERQDCREMEDFEYPENFRCMVCIESPLLKPDMGTFMVLPKGISIRGQHAKYFWKWDVIRFLEAGPAQVRLLVYHQPVTIVGRVRAALLGAVAHVHA
jgi:hypothetical protein